MPKTTPIDIPVISGIKRQVETNDKPPYVSSYIRDMIQPVRGVWERRPGYVKAHPDRGQDYEFTTPRANRNITYCGKDGGDGCYQYKLSHKRKTMAVGLDGGVQYLFSAVIATYFLSVDLEDQASGYYQEVRIYRSALGADGVSNEWDRGAFAEYTANALARNNTGAGYAVTDEYFIECSMVMNAAKRRLYLAVALHIDGETDYVRLFDLNNLYGDLSDVTWTERKHAGNSIETLTVASDERATHDIDIDIDDTGKVHIPVIIRIDGSEFETENIHYWKFNPLSLTFTFDGITTGAETEGLVLKTIPIIGDATQQMCMIYKSIQSIAGDDNALWGIYRIIFDIDEFPVVANAVVLGYNQHVYSASSYNFGASLAIDSDGTPVICYREQDTGSRVVIVIGTDSIIEVCDNLYLGLGVFNGVVNTGTNYDFIVKDGLICVYYSRSLTEDERIVDGAVCRLVRKVFIYDTTDADYTGSFGEEELVGESEWINRYVSCYNTYESDCLKRVQIIVEANEYNRFNYIRQDRAHHTLAGANAVVQKSVHRYNAAGVDGLDKLTVLQCECLEGDTKYRFYYRGAWHWNLLEGQMDEVNESIIQETTINDRARFWDNNGILRAGCGIEDGNTPIWYGLIDRQIYRNEARYALRGRRFRLAELPPPDIDIAVISEVPVLYAEIIADDAESQNFYDKESLDANNAGVPWKFDVIDQGDTRTIEGFAFRGSRVSHKFKTVNDGFLQALADYLTTDLGETTYIGFANNEELKLPYTEFFVGFAYRYDNGQISQITTQAETDPFVLGVDIRDYDSDMFANAQAGVNPVMYNGWLHLDLQIPRWELGGSNPRRTSLIVLMAELTSKGQTKTDDTLVWKPWKEFAIAMPYRDPFNPEPNNEESQWTIIQGDQVAYKSGQKLDWGAFNKNLLTETAVDYIGTGAILNKEPLEKHTLDGYVQAIVAGGRPFYLGIRLNDEKLEEAFIWGVDSINGGAYYVSPDVISPAFMNLCKFLIKGGKSFNTSNIVIIGDTDIEYGSVEGEGNAANWLIRGTEQDVGCLARDSIVNLAEVGYDNGMGTLYIDNNGYTRLFQSYGSRIVGNDVFKAFVRGYKAETPVAPDVVATRHETSYGGLESLAASNAMAIYLAQYRLLMIGFPSSSLMLVRNFAAEGGEEWAEWRFANVPLAWCVAPEGYLLFTDGAQLFKWDGSATTDDGTAIQPQGILADVPVPINGVAEVARIGASYILAGTVSPLPTLKLTVIRDDGERTDQYVALPVKTVKGWEFRRVSWQKPVNAQFAVKWELTTPANCTKFELHALKAEVEVERYE